MNIIKKEIKPKLFLINANIITFDPLFPNADWLLLGGGKIIDIGISSKRKPPVPAKKEIIDCGGKTVLPGFIDSHMHLFSMAESHVTLNLKPSNKTNSIEDIKTKIKTLSKTLPKGAWIRGKGYNEFYLTEKRHPNSRDLDEVTPEHPVKLSHRSGHAHVLNSLGLKLTGITPETPDPPGSIIDRDALTGQPSGILYEMGGYLNERIPRLRDEEIEKGLLAADKELISNGITSIQDASSNNNYDRYNKIKKWKDNSLLHPHVNMMIGMDNVKNYKSWDIYNHPEQINCVKIILDETTGDLFPDQAELDEMVLAIHESGMQAAIHAIEENAIESVCSAIEKALIRKPKADHRHRIEHCSVCPTNLAKRIARLGVRVVTQPGFIYASGDRYLEKVDIDKQDFLYASAGFLESGIIAAGSSDSPIAPSNPMLAVYSAVTRKTSSGNIVAGHEKISPADALRMYTINGANVSFSEKIKGSILPGKLADLVILSDDPINIAPDDIKDIKVEMTIIDGNIKWDTGNIFHLTKNA